MGAKPRARKGLSRCGNRRWSVWLQSSELGDRGDEALTEARPYRAVGPDKEFQFYSSTKGSHLKVLVFFFFLSFFLFFF